MADEKQDEELPELSPRELSMLKTLRETCKKRNITITLEGNLMLIAKNGKVFRKEPISFIRELTSAIVIEKQEDPK